MKNKKRKRARGVKKLLEDRLMGGARAKKKLNSRKACARV